MNDSTDRETCSDDDVFGACSDIYPEGGIPREDWASQVSAFLNPVGVAGNAEGGNMSMDDAQKYSTVATPIGTAAGGDAGCPPEPPAPPLITAHAVEVPVDQAESAVPVDQAEVQAAKTFMSIMRQDTKAWSKLGFDTVKQQDTKAWSKLGIDTASINLKTTPKLPTLLSDWFPISNISAKNLRDQQSDKKRSAKELRCITGFSKMSKQRMCGAAFLRELCRIDDLFSVAEPNVMVDGKRYTVIVVNRGKFAPVSMTTRKKNTTRYLFSCELETDCKNFLAAIQGATCTAAHVEEYYGQERRTMTYMHELIDTEEDHSEDRSEERSESPLAKFLKHQFHDKVSRLRVKQEKHGTRDADSQRAKRIRRGTGDVDELKQFNDILCQVRSGDKDLSALEGYIQQTSAKLVAPLVLKHVLFDLTQPGEDLDGPVHDEIDKVIQAIDEERRKLSVTPEESSGWEAPCAATSECAPMEPEPESDAELSNRKLYWPAVLQPVYGASSEQRWHPGHILHIVRVGGEATTLIDTLGTLDAGFDLIQFMGHGHRGGSCLPLPMDNEHVISMLDTVGTKNQANRWLPIVFFNTCCSAELRQDLERRHIACSCGHPGEPQNQFCVDYSVSLHRCIAAADFEVETQKDVCKVYRLLFDEAYSQLLECEQSLSYEISECIRPVWLDPQITPRSREVLQKEARREARREVRRNLARQQGGALRSVTSATSDASSDVSFEPMPIGHENRETRCWFSGKAAGFVVLTLAVVMTVVCAILYMNLHTTACNNEPCKNGATCTASGGTHSCTCASGWKFVDCSQSTGCDNEPCKNGATCTASGGTHSCTCASGWDGDDCTRQCSGHGRIDNSTMECICEEGWSGEVCSSTYSKFFLGNTSCPVAMPILEKVSWSPVGCEGDCDLKQKSTVCCPYQICQSSTRSICYNYSLTGWPNGGAGSCTTEAVTQLRAPECAYSGFASCTDMNKQVLGKKLEWCMFYNASSPIIGNCAHPASCAANLTCHNLCKRGRDAAHCPHAYCKPGTRHCDPAEVNCWSARQTHQACWNVEWDCDSDATCLKSGVHMPGGGLKCQPSAQNVEGVECTATDRLIMYGRNAACPGGAKPLKSAYESKSCGIYSGAGAGCYECTTMPGFFALGTAPGNRAKPTCLYSPSQPTEQLFGASTCFGKPAVCEAGDVIAVMCPQAAADHPPPNHADRLEYEQLSSSKSDFLHADRLEYERLSSSKPDLTTGSEPDTLQSA